MKLSKNFRQLYFIDLIIKLKRYLYQSFSYIITIIYLRLIAQYKNFSLIKTIGKGAGFYVSASKNDQKLLELFNYTFSNGGGNINSRKLYLDFLNRIVN